MGNNIPTGVGFEKLYDKDGNLICDEMYYHFYENSKPNPVWVEGLKWVYDAYDQTGDKEFDDALEFLDDDQEIMLSVLDTLISMGNPQAKLVSIFANYVFNEDGSKNLIKQICLIYECGKENYLVIRTPFYAFSEYAKTTFFNQIMGGK